MLNVETQKFSKLTLAPISLGILEVHMGACVCVLWVVVFAYMSRRLECRGGRGKVMLEGIFNCDSTLLHSTQDKSTSITECPVCAQNWGMYVQVS